MKEEEEEEEEEEGGRAVGGVFSLVQRAHVARQKKRAFEDCPERDVRLGLLREADAGPAFRVNTDNYSLSEISDLISDLIIICIGTDSQMRPDHVK